ncbi:MAG: DUF6273 domain-containing protein [Oscillospiraceae bacterium]
MRYHKSELATEQIAVTWGTGTIRSWLNNTFLNQAFTSEEQEKILPTTVVNAENAEYQIIGSNDTIDQIFLLNMDEIEQHHCAEIFTELSDYAAATPSLSAYAEDNIYRYKALLRSNCYNGQSVYVLNCLYDHGSVCECYSNESVTFQGAVRPAIWVSLDR